MYKIFFFAVLLLFSCNATAYFDPASGSILLQGLLAALAGIMLAWGLFLDKIKRFFGFRKKSDSDTESKE